MQIMHVGPYSDEPRSVALLEDFIEENGLLNQTGNERKHHEIYLSDPRKMVSEKLRKVLRLPIAKVFEK